MEITKNMLFFWIKNRWPNAINIENTLQKKARVTRPMFWSSAQEMRGHLVVVDPNRLKHIDRFYSDTIFVCIGSVGTAAFETSACIPVVSTAHTANTTNTKNTAGIVYAADTKFLCHNNEIIIVPDEDKMQKAFNYLAIIFDRFYTWASQLDQASDEFFSYDAIIRSCESIMDDPLALLDADFNYVTYSKKKSMERGFEELYVDESGRLPLEIINMLISNDEFSSLAKKKGVWRYEGSEVMLHANVFHADTFVGRLGVPYTTDSVRNAYNADILEIVVAEIEALYARLGTFFRQPAQNAKLRHLIASLSEGTTVPREEIRSQLEMMGCEENDTYCLVQVQPQLSETTKRYTSVLLAHLEMLVSKSVCFVAKEACYLLIDKSKNSPAAQKKFVNDINTFLRENYMRAGLSRDFKNIFELKIAVKQTSIALAYGRRIDPMFWYVKYDSYAFFYALSCMCRDMPAAHIASYALRTLQEHDIQSGSFLYKTLRVYIEAQYNAVEAAKQLFISRSTFLRRIETIKKLTGINLDSYDDRLYLELSYRMLDSDVLTDIEVE